MRNASRTGNVAAAAITTTVAVVAALFVGSAARAVARPGPDLPTILALQTTAESETIYFEQCAPCHGPVGGGAVGPALTASILSADERESIIREGRGAMPAFEVTLNQEEIEAISALAGRLAATTIYEQQCSPCHGPNGEGGIGPALVPADLSYDDSLLIISEGRAAMPAFAPTLTADELDSVTAFVRHLAQVQLGAETYARLCAACHGAAGEGAAGPALVESYLPPGEIITVISEGAGTMPGFGVDLSDSELQAIIVFVHRLVAGVATFGPPVVDETQLYLDLCAFCHGADGEGGAGPPLVALGLSEAELSTLITEGQGGMPGFAADLSEEDLDGLVAYVQSSFGDQEQAATGAELYVELCAACHGAVGEGGAGPPLVALGLSEGELSTLIAEGRGSMPGFADQLSGDGVADLVEYLAAAFGGEDSSTTTTPAAPVLSGLDMFVVHCATCHAADGSGGLGPDLRDFDLSLNEVISRIYGGHADGMPAFEGELTGLEVQELARYVTTLYSDPDGAGSGASVWLWPVVGGLLMLAGLAGFLFLRRSRSPKAEVLPRGSE